MVVGGLWDIRTVGIGTLMSHRPDRNQYLCPLDREKVTNLRSK